jgi:hypothetical protein
VEVSRSPDGEVLVQASLDTSDVGHAFPTGDLYRRAELRFWLDAPTHGRSLVFTRSFEPQPERLGGDTVFVRRQRSDTRAPPPGFGRPAVRSLQMEDPGRRARTLHWALDYLLMAPSVAAVQHLTLEQISTRIKEGTVNLDASSQQPTSPNGPGDHP